MDDERKTRSCRDERSSFEATRDAFRARSPAEFIGKLESGLQELGETAYWRGLLADGGVVLAGDSVCSSGRRRN